MRPLRQRHGIAADRAEEQDASTLNRWIQEAFVAVEGPAPAAPWLVRVDAALRSRVCESVPEGFVAAAEARKRLRVSRQTLWDRIRSGQLEARRIVRGPRKGLYVQLDEPEQLLLDGPEESSDAKRPGGRMQVPDQRGVRPSRAVKRDGWSAVQCLWRTRKSDGSKEVILYIVPFESRHATG